MNILVKRLEKCFKKSFFKNALERALKNLFPSVKMEDVIIISDGDEGVIKACRMLELQHEEVSPEDHPDTDAIIAFWDGPKYNKMPVDLVDPASEALAKFLAHYQQNGSVGDGSTDIRHQFPSWKFRAIQAIFNFKKQGIHVDEEYAISQFLKYKTLATQIEDQLQVGEDSELTHNQDVIKRVRYDNGRADDDNPVDETVTEVIDAEQVRRQFLDELEIARFYRNLWEQIAMNFDQYEQYA